MYDALRDPCLKGKFFWIQNFEEFTVRPQKFQCPILGSRGKLFYSNCDETVPKVSFLFEC
jgi:hypothetical protein